MASDAFSHAIDNIEETSACFVAMPNKRLFTHIDPVLELKKHNTELSIARGRGSNQLKGGTNGYVFDTITGVQKERPNSRQRSKTPDIVSSAKKWSPRSDGASFNEHEFSKKVNFLSQPNAKPVVKQSKTKPKPAIASKEAETKSNLRTLELQVDGTIMDGKRRKSEPPHQLKQPVNSGNRPRFEFTGAESWKQTAGSRKRSLSVPPDPDQSLSISTIVKARSLAMKWRGKKGRMGRRHTVLPTITDDTAKFSLCANVKCSPQFEEVIKILQGDEEVEHADNSFKLLNLK